jgi:hypothetical protein
MDYIAAMSSLSEPEISRSSAKIVAVPAPPVADIPISADARFASAGSFATPLIGEALGRHGLFHLDLEPAPPFMSAEEGRDFGYGKGSIRTGGIFTSRQLLQLAQRAILDTSPERGVWNTPSGRWLDGFRPTVEADEFGSPDEVLALRVSHHAAARQCFEQADVFIFLMGLSEAWEGTSDGLVYPHWPGTLNADFSPRAYRLRKFTVSEVVADLSEFILLVRTQNADLRVILCVPSWSLAVAPTHGQRLTATAQSEGLLNTAAETVAGQHSRVEVLHFDDVVSAEQLAEHIALAMQMRTRADAEPSLVSEVVTNDEVQGAPWHGWVPVDDLILAQMGTSLG